MRRLSRSSAFWPSGRGFSPFTPKTMPPLNHLETRGHFQEPVEPGTLPPTHPDICEAEALFHVLSLAEVTGCAMFLPHLSARRSLEVVRLFRRWSTLRALFTETCSHYLTLTQAALTMFGNLAKMSTAVADPGRHRRPMGGIGCGRNRRDRLGCYGAPDREQGTPAQPDAFGTLRHGQNVDNLVALAFDEGVAKGRMPVTTFVEDHERDAGQDPRAISAQGDARAGRRCGCAHRRPRRRRDPCPLATRT